MQILVFNITFKIDKVFQVIIIIISLLLKIEIFSNENSSMEWKVFLIIIYCPTLMISNAMLCTNLVKVVIYMRLAKNKKTEATED